MLQLATKQGIALLRGKLEQYEESTVGHILMKTVPYYGAARSLKRIGDFIITKTPVSRNLVWS